MFAAIRAKSAAIGAAVAKPPSSLCPPAAEANRLRLRAAMPLTLAASVLALAGCASFSDDAGMTDVAGIARETLHKDVVAVRSVDDAARADSAVQNLLRRPLTADAAVQLALLNNKSLQAA